MFKKQRRRRPMFATVSFRTTVMSDALVQSRCKRPALAQNRCQHPAAALQQSPHRYHPVRYQEQGTSGTHWREPALVHSPSRPHQSLHLCLWGLQAVPRPLCWVQAVCWRAAGWLVGGCYC